MNAPASLPQNVRHARATRTQLGWMLLAAALTTVPHFSYQYAWVCGLAVFLLAARAYTLWKGIRVPLKWASIPLVLGFAVGIYFQFDRQFFGIVPGVAYLTLMLALKVHEGDAARDVRIALCLIFFLQLGLFFNVQGMFSAVEAIAAAWAATVALVSGYDTRAPARAQLKTSGLLLLQALPMMVVFFLLFPRIPGPLWGQNSAERQGKTGLSDSMKPGDVQNLSLSDEIAFRARFEGAPPASSQRYWRGPVLELFDGQAWTMALEGLPYAQPVFQPTGPALNYTLTLEAHNRPWLLGMDFSAGVSGAEFRYNRSFAVLARTPVTERVRYALTAYPDAKPGQEESLQVRARNLVLPPQSNPRAQAFAHTLAPPGTPPEEALAKVMAHFAQSGYTYTLAPAEVGIHAVDDFLFSTREGFCEYFSSAFVVLMRAAGVPARVVTGYLGGELNPSDETLIIRQADAHAWAEVWLAGQGWVRVDPTALSAPARLGQGMAGAQRDQAALPMLMRPEFAWLRQARYRWEAVANTWNQWVLGYDQARQRELLSRLGFQNPDWRTLIPLLFGTVFLAAMALLVWVYRNRTPRDALDKVWQQFCQNMARKGCARAPWEGALAYGERLAQHRPEQADALRGIAQHYARLRYQPRPWAADLPALREQIRRLR